jgi:hypothetical protein
MSFGLYWLGAFDTLNTVETVLILPYYAQTLRHDGSASLLAFVSATTLDGWKVAWIGRSGFILFSGFLFVF